MVLTGWLAALWFLIVPEFSRWQMPQLAAIHLAPPVMAWGVWTIWRRHRQNRAEKTVAERASLSQKECQEKSDAARQKHAARLSHLRYGCDCRALAMTQVTAPGGDEALVPEVDAISLATVGSDAYGEDSDEQNLLEHLQPGIEEALQSIYLSCPAALAFPIYIAPPADMAGEDVIACLRRIRAELATAFDAPHRTEFELGRILFLLSTDSVAGSIIGLFETNPELPAALILAFDSPAWRASKQEGGDDGEGSAASKAQRQLHGQPGQGIFALFMTNAQLPEMLRTAPFRQVHYDAMTPFWEKPPSVSGRAAYLDILSETEHAALQSAPVLARIHRAASIEFLAKPPRSMELSRSIEDLLKHAQIQAALAELSPESQPELPPGSPPESSDSTAPDYHWLIHNAGGVDHSGLRLSALGVALFRRGIELDPIAEASNITVRIGDLGQARGVAMLALTVARAASGEGAALCAEFTGNGSARNSGMSLSFAMAEQGNA